MGLRTYESHATLRSCTPLHVRVLFVVCVGWAQAICRNKMLSLIFFFIPLVELTNQKMGNCRHYILYPLRLGPPFLMMLEL